ncbi:sulfotransferase (plasmid) [Azospirillum oryzae]|uniref:Sulfotransferase n=1 Tax=Azospirillum oryzae TaxID=286727 RepID=A0A6N1AC40_9PROT|nr:sulfotransferase [Azospirillum oryzae]KAA0586585.1 sulfotransferase [Azospirillum oryzae]QKS49030.1 sulfotransferase [Azospirillum oryzae]GLR82228.1 hypothetical protein GCM10007856_49220 [Azospirillum oryzae]
MPEQSPASDHSDVGYDSEGVTYLVLTGVARSGTTVMTDILNESSEIVVFAEYPMHELVGKVDGIFDYHRLLTDYVERIQPEHQPEHQPEKPLDEKLVDDGAASSPEPVDSNPSEPASDQPHHIEALSSQKPLSDGVDTFRATRELAIQLKHRERAPTEELLKPILNHTFALASGKRNLKIMGCKTPNYFDLTNIDYIKDKLGNLKIIIMVRNPIDVVNSSIARRNKAMVGADVWPIRNIDEECEETSRLFMDLRSVAERFDNDIFLIKYEDIQNSRDKISKGIVDFLGLEEPLRMDMFESIPESLRRYALSSEEQTVSHSWFGHIEAVWPTLDLTGPASSKRIEALSVFAPLVRCGDGQDMSSPSSRRFLLNGWSVIEPWGIWSDSEAAELVFSAQPGSEPSEVTVTLILSPCRISDFAVRVWRNGEDLGWLTFSSDDEPEYLTIVRSEQVLPLGHLEAQNSMTLEIPLSYLEGYGLWNCRITFDIQNAVSLADNGHSADTRKLGVGLTHLAFS